LLAWRWEQIVWEQGFVTLQADETKSGHARAVPILAGDMLTWLKWARAESNGCANVFHRVRGTDQGIPRGMEERLQGCGSS
jgi:hypothetical protein